MRLLIFMENRGDTPELRGVQVPPILHKTSGPKTDQEGGHGSRGAHAAQALALRERLRCALERSRMGGEAERLTGKGGA